MKMQQNAFDGPTSHGHTGYFPTAPHRPIFNRIKGQGGRGYGRRDWKVREIGEKTRGELKWKFESPL